MDLTNTRKMSVNTLHRLDMKSRSSIVSKGGLDQ